ncbi:MAG: glycosyltransferase [Ilumatobacteraceae bacterium]
MFHPGTSDPSIRAELSADPDALVLLVLGRLDPSKGVDTVIRAVAAAERADRRPIHLAIAGTGSLDLRHEADLASWPATCSATGADSSATGPTWCR